MATKIALLASEPIPVPDLHATMAVRVAAGRAARKRARGAALVSGTRTSRRHDPLTTVLAQSESRLPEVVPLRHHRMSLSPWNYYPGAAGVMAADLASRPNSGLEVQLCGDAHVLNFGLWATPERNLNFDLRDFDETLPGPFEWDLARLAASLVVAARENGVKAPRVDAAVRAVVDAYRRGMYRYAQAYELDIWYDGMRVNRFVQHFEHADRGQVKIFIEKGKKKRTSLGAYPKLTAIASGRPRITPQFPIPSPCPTTNSATSSTPCSRAIGTPSEKIGAPSSTDLPSWTSFDRWSESAASAWSSTSYCSKAAPAPPCSSNANRRALRSTRPTYGRPHRSTAANE